MTGGEHKLMVRNPFQHGPGLGQDPAGIVDDRHRPDLHPLRAQLVLHLRPGGQVLPRLWCLVTGRLIDRVNGRQPDGPGALPGRDLHRQRVHTADRGVERDRAQNLDAGDGRPHERGPFGRRHIVRFEYEPGLAGLAAPPRELHVVDPPADHVGIEVDM